MRKVASGCSILNKDPRVPTLGPPDPQARALTTPTYRRAWNLLRSALSTDTTLCFSPTKAPKQESSVHSNTEARCSFLVLAAPGFILSTLGNSGHTAFCPPHPQQALHLDNSTSSSKSGCNTPSSRQSPVPSLQPLLHSFPTRMIQWAQMLPCVLNRVGLWAQGSGLVFTPIISSPSAWALAHSGDGAGPPESMS